MKQILVKWGTALGHAGAPASTWWQTVWPWVALFVVGFTGFLSLIASTNWLLGLPPLEIDGHSVSGVEVPWQIARVSAIAGLIALAAGSVLYCDTRWRAYKAKSSKAKAEQRHPED